jgi:hypothetical protein
VRPPLVAWLSGSSVGRQIERGLPEQIVERSVLEHDHDDMVERNPAVRRGHRGTSSVEPKLRGAQRR